MPTTPWADRLPYAYALLRAAMLVLFSLALVLAPERALAGSSHEPMRTLALMFASRTIVLGIALAVLALGRKREALGWVLLADGALQVFDTGMALATDKGALALAPAVLAALDAWAGVALLRRGRRDAVTSS